MKKIKQATLNQDVQNYCDIAWGLKELRENRAKPVVYRNIDLVSSPQTPNGHNPIVVCKDDFRIYNKPEPVKHVHWFIRLFRKVRGYFK